MNGRGILVALCAVLAVSACGDEPLAGGASGADTTFLGRLTDSPDGSRVHLVRMVASGDSASFTPAELTVQEGDLVRFVMGSSKPESVTFEVDGLAPDAVEFVRTQGLRTGELLTGSGQVYDVSFRGAPPGRYPFRSLPHGDRGMRGVVIVTE